GFERCGPRGRGGAVPVPGPDREPTRVPGERLGRGVVSKPEVRAHRGSIDTRGVWRRARGGWLVARDPGPRSRSRGAPHFTTTPSIPSSSGGISGGGISA